MKAYVINLDRSEDRLAHMQREFERIGLSFTRVPAVDGGSFSEDFLNEFARMRPIRMKWTPGIAACFLSHRDVWRRIAEGTADVAAVFEDDVHLACDMARLLASDDWLPSDADLVRLEANGPMILRQRRPIKVCPDRYLYRAASGTWGSAGYIVTKRTARLLLEAPVEMHRAPDVYMFKPGVSPLATTLNRYQVKPAVCVQDMLLNSGAFKLPSIVGSQFPVEESLRKRSNWLKRLWPRHKQPVPFQR